MKKSECFRLAQESVIRSVSLSAETKIEVLRVLIQEEDMASFMEQAKEAKGASNGKL